MNANILVVLIILVAGLFLGGEGKSKSLPSHAAEGSYPLEVLRNSNDPTVLMQTAITMASSDLAADHAAIGKELLSNSFLDRLDSKEGYAGTISSLHLTRIVDALMANRKPSVERVLIALAMDNMFQSHALRKILTIRALSAITPSPPEAIRFWDTWSKPDSPLASDVIAALCSNQSMQALKLLEKKFTDEKFISTKRTFWMRQYILPKRNDLALLIVCERMVNNTLQDSLRPVLVDVLFDYQPSKWYRGDDPPKPPPISSASAEARAILGRIGRHALASINLPPATKKAVQARLKEI